MGSRLTSHQLVTSYVVKGFLLKGCFKPQKSVDNLVNRIQVPKNTSNFYKKFLRCAASTWMLLLVDPPSTCNPIYFRQEAKHRSRIISGRPKYLLLRCDQCSRMFGLTEEHGHRLLLICSMFLDLNL